MQSVKDAVTKLYDHKQAKKIKRDILKIAVKVILMYRDKKVTIAESMAMRGPCLRLAFAMLDALESAECKNEIRKEASKGSKVSPEEALRRAYLSRYNVGKYISALQEAFQSVFSILRNHMRPQNQAYDLNRQEP